MSWLRFAPKGYTHAHHRLCWGTGGLADQGIPFQTEYRIAGFTVDIYIAPDLIVEVDGASHQRESRRTKDAWKDAVLMQHGYTVLRFTEQQIQKHFDETVSEIIDQMKFLPYTYTYTYTPYNIT